MQKLNASFQIFALMNGTNVAGRMGIINGPLRQQYTEGTTTYVPDWETSARKPLIYPHLTRTDNGQILTPTTTDLYYNGVKVEFGGDGLSTTGAMAGVFKRALKAVNIGGVDYPNMITFEIVKNIVPISNFDNDSILLKGTTEVSGQTLSFDGISETVEIVKSTGSQTTLYIDGDKEITSARPTAQLNAHVLLNGNPADESAYEFKWSKIKGTQTTNFKTGASITVAESDVDGSTTFRCDLVLKGNTTVIVSAYTYVIDYIDPYRPVLYMDGIEGGTIKPGETAAITAKVEKPDGTVVPGIPTTFTVRDNSGVIMPAFSGDKASIQITYDDVKAAGMGISGYVSATFAV